MLVYSSITNPLSCLFILTESQTDLAENSVAIKACEAENIDDTMCNMDRCRLLSPWSDPKFETSLRCPCFLGGWEGELYHPPAYVLPDNAIVVGRLVDVFHLREEV